MNTIAIHHDQIETPTVTFPEGNTQCESQIAWFTTSEKHGACFVVLKESCFHPRDFRWPDQPADKGTLQINGETLEVLDVVKMLSAPTVEPLFDTDIPFTKRDLPENSRLISTIKVDIQYAALLEEAFTAKTSVIGQVDEDYRLALSTGHAAGHLASYALNEAIAPYWRKTVPLDTRGNPDFIRQTQDRSQVVPSGCQDGFRLGKSTRKAGLNVADLATDLEAVEAKANAILSKWLELKPSIYFEKDGPALDESRVWHCKVGEENFSMFCGGTHVKNFDHVNAFNIELSYADQEMALSVTAAIK